MSPSTPPRHASPLNPSTPPQSRSRTAPSPSLSRPPSDFGRTTADSRYPPARNLASAVPSHILGYRPNTPSTVQRAINTALPATPPRQLRSYVPSNSPSRAGTDTDTDVELSHIPSQAQSDNSPFHDRHSIIVDAVDDLADNWSPGSYKQKTAPGYRFAGMRDDDTKEELEFGDELQAPVFISEKRRSLYPVEAIPLSTLHDHPDLQPSGDHIGGPDGITPDYAAPVRYPPPPPVVPHFRRLLSLSSWRDICFLFIPGMLLASATALVPPFMSIVIGDTFEVFAQYPIITSLASPAQRTALLEGVRYQTIKLSSAGLFAMVANYIKAVVWSWHGEVVAARLREKVFAGVQEKGMDWYDMGMGMRDDEEGEEAVGAGGLMSKFSKETDDVRLACAQAMGNFVQYFGSFLLCFILAMVKSPVLSLVTLSTIPLVVIVQIVTQVIIMPMYSAERRGFAEASTNIERSTNAIATVKAHNAEPAEKARFNRIVERVRETLAKQAVVWAASVSLTDFLLLATFVSGFWYGAALVRQGKLERGAVMTVFWACLLASSYLQQAVPTLSFITKGKMSMASLLTVIQDVAPDPARAPKPKDKRKSKGEMDISSPFSPDNSPVNSTFRPTSLTIPGTRPISMSKITPTKCIGEFNLVHVSFAYPSRPDNPVLRDITLFIPPGETTFIVGGSGSGKSTIAQLLLRLYNPDGGEITLDDQSFPFLDESFTRANIAAVQQGCILFDMSVHDNVALGLAGAGPGVNGNKRRPEDVSRAEVEEACKMAMIHDFIVGLPEGYETRLGTGGSSLSGGQRQRLAIARARIRDPSILILDEATSALDATSRVQVFENLKSWRRNRTTIVITHDLSQIVPDDFVYVMKHGVVAEQGFRSDLMRKTPSYGEDYGVFASMAAEQAVEPVPLKWEEQATIEMVDDDRDAMPLRPGMGRRGSNTGSFAIRPQSMAYFDILDEYARGNRTSAVPAPVAAVAAAHGTRPEMVSKGSSAYLGAAYGGATSTAIDAGYGRGLTAAQKRLSWGPQDLNPKLSRGLLAPPSAYGNTSKTSLVQPYSRPSSALSNRPGSRMSITRQGSFEGSPYSVTVTPSAAARTSIHGRPANLRQRTLSQDLDDELKYKTGSSGDLDVLDLPAEHAIAVTDEDKGTIPGIFRIIATNLPLMPRKWLFILGLVGSLAHGIATPVWANYLSRLMSIVAGGGSDPMLTTYALIVLAICVAQATAGYIQEWALYAVSAGWTASIRTTAYERVLAQDKSWFDRPGNAPAVLVQNIIKDADDMRNAVSQIAGKIVVFFSMVTMGVVWAMVVQWRLTLVGLATGPVFVVVVVVNEGLVGKAEMRNKDMRDRVGKMFYESVSNIRGIRAMALESTFRDKFAIEASAAQRTGKMAAFYVGVGIAVSACMPLVAMSLLNWVGCKFILDGYMDYPTMLMVYNLILFSLTFGALALDFIPMMAKVKVAARDFNRLYNLSLLTSESAGEQRFPITGHVSFDNVHFAYPTRPDVPVLSGVSFRLQPGECVAIVGPSGSGKSTIAALLQRLYEPTHSPIGAPVSRIMMDKHDLSASDVKWLRNHIAVVSQTANLFDASVSENIAYGSEVSVEEIERAAKAASIHEFILTLPDGYDTNLGENASLISGGQAQRLQIARALVRRSQILILDEATSALDVGNQRAVLDTIVKIKETRTTIFITHSVEAMKRCDRIICLDNGKVAEDGSYDALVRRNGVFAQLMKMGEWE